MRFFDGSITDAVRSIKQGTFTCREVVARSLEEIKKGDGELNSFISVNDESALKKADVLDKLTNAEKESFPLLGIPVAVKDNMCTTGVATTCASHILENFIPPYNATVVDLLEKAGAVVVGKTNLDEFAMGSSTENSHFGPTKNPVDKTRIPGGSSGGSAAAVGAGFVPAALGSDTGGSIRQPASHCGVFGLKPTYGRVSRYGLVAFASSLDQIGPFASDVRDIGLLLSIISQPDQRDSTCAGRIFKDDCSLYDGNLKNIRIGLPKEYFGEGLADEVRTALLEQLDMLKRAGASCVDISLPNVGHAIAAYYIICTAEASSNLARYDGVKYGLRSKDPESLLDMYMETRAEGFGDEVKRRIMLGTYVLSSGYYDAYYLKAAKVRTLIAGDFKNAFEKCDVIFSPVTPTPPFKIGEKISDPIQMYLTDIYTVSANLAGIPGISVPCQMKGKLPIGAQFMSPQWREDLLLKVSSAIGTRS